MSGWNDPDKLAEARAAHASFTSRSPDSRGQGGRRGRGRGSASPSPARGVDNFGNNMHTAGRGRGGPPTLASGGRGGFGEPARVGGSGGRTRPAVPLATSEQFFALLDNENATNVPTGGSPSVYSANDTSAARTAQNTIAQNADNFSGGGPMELDQPAQSSNTSTNLPNSGRNPVTSRWANPSGVSEATQGSVVKNADTSGGPVGLNNSKHVQPNATPMKPGCPKRGLMSSQWGTAADSVNTGTGAPHSANAIPTQEIATKSTGNIGTNMKIDKGVGNPKDASSKAGTNHSLFGSRWATAPPSPPINPSELAPIYRSHNWMKDLQEENEAETKRRAALSHAGQPGEANGISRGPCKDPAMHTPATSNMRGQAYSQRPATIQSGTQPVGQQSANFNRVGAAHTAVDSTQAYPRAGFDGPPSSATFGTGVTAQSGQQPNQPVGNNVGQQVPQAARPSDRGTGQQSAQSSQHSQNPFDDPEFKDFWDNYYLPNNG